LTTRFNGDGDMVLNATFNNISVIWWRSVLLVEEIRVAGENHRLVASTHLWKVLYQDYSFCPDPLTNMVRIKKFLLWMNCYFVGMSRLGCFLFVCWCLTPRSTIFQLYRGCQFYWWRTLSFCRKLLHE
jgi:hypothetical protein